MSFRTRLSVVSSLLILPAGLLLAQSPTLDTTTFVVMGEGLAAGMANYGLSSVVQNYSFPAQMARQMNTAFPQPLIQPPGIGDVVGYPRQDVRVPTYPQGTVRVFPPQPDPNNNAPTLFVLNLSVPGFTLADSTTLRPVSPVVQRDSKQTVTNMILGFPQLILSNPVPLWTQFEYAQAMQPTLVLMELGYYEALDAAVNGDPTRMPDPASFAAQYSNILSGLRGLQAQVIATTIPNPLDTAYFTPVAEAAKLLQVQPYVLLNAFHLTQQDYITRNGLLVITNQIQKNSLSPLPAGSVLTAATAAALTGNVQALNAQILNAAKSNRAVVYDLSGLFHRVRTSGVQVGGATLTADYLGGFYSLDGVYPGPTGHALVANDILALLNQTYQQSFAMVDTAAVAANDATLGARRPQGAIYSASKLGIHRRLEQRFERGMR